MSKPIYLLVIGKGFTDAWYALSKEEQDSLWAKVQAVDETILGTKMEED